MINFLSKDSNKLVNKVRKSVHKLNKNVRNMDEKFSKDIEIVKKNGIVENEKFNKHQ
jgi:hypothetical protein